MNDNIRILMIDDDEDFCTTVKHVLQLTDCSPVLECRHTLEEGIERLKQNELDAVLLDLDLPDSHGIDTLRSVKKISRYIAVVILTGVDDGDTESEAFDLGVQEYLPKNKMTATSLRRVIMNSIKRERSRYREEFEKGIDKFDQRLEQFKAIGRSQQQRGTVG